MLNVNRVTLLGHVTRDPDMHVAKTGNAVATIGLATNARIKKGDGMTTEAEFHRLVCFGQLADFIGKRVKKGSPLYVEGKLHTGHFKTKEGKEASKTDIFVDRIVLLSSDRKGEMQGATEEVEMAA